MGGADLGDAKGVRRLDVFWVHPDEGSALTIYEIRDDQLRAVSPTSFSAEGLYERRDIQRLLKENIQVLGDDLMVMAEEFGEWTDSSRRIDLLCLDKNANLVVVELKRTEDGGHMDLQALRYAAMVSPMKFDQLVNSHARFRNSRQPDIEVSRSAILDFLGWDNVDAGKFAQEVRIILGAADFSKELTTAVLWLRERKIDMRCVRLKPYRRVDGPVLIEVQQLIPLPEAAEFQTQLGVKREDERKARAEQQDLRYLFMERLLAYAKTRTPLHANRTADSSGWIAAGIGRGGFQLTYTFRQNDSQVELWISHGPGQAARNKAAFAALERQKAEIDAAFGEQLDWQPLPEAESSRIRHVVPGGYKARQEDWPAIHAVLVDHMIRLDATLRPRVAALSY